MKRAEQQIKEVYRLWVEYLKRSEDYKVFCQWMVKRRKNPNLPVPIKFQKNKDRSAPKELFNYLTFGNIYDSAYPFDEWWEYHKEKLNYMKTHKSPKAIEDFTEHIGRYIDIATDSFKRHHGKEPSLQELKEWLTEHIMKKIFDNSLYLMIDITDETVEKQFTRLVKERRKYPHIRAFDLVRRKNKIPTLKYETIDELKTYLDIYKLREQGLGPKEVIKKHNPKYKETDKGYDSLERLYRMYFQKAKRIIKNVERGFFPGKY